MIDATTPEAMARAQGLFWDTTNWQALCKPHHDQKTAKETGWKGL
jgi:5-methylcytosine-specific restriction protein A